MCWLRISFGIGDRVVIYRNLEVGDILNGLAAAARRAAPAAALAMLAIRRRSSGDRIWPAFLPWQVLQREFRLVTCAPQPPMQR